MTKAQKSLFKSLKKDGHRAGFVQMLTAQQERLGKLAKRKIAAEKIL